LKILQVHNFYQHPGGEDQVYAAEYELLVNHGHQVTRYQADNDDISQISGARAALITHWNGTTYRAIRRISREQQPDIIHSHNTFPLISPSLYYAAAAEHVPVIQTLHNYRLICPGANLYRDGHVCEDCVGSFVPYGAVLHRCYRASLPASIVSASMLATHRLLGTWTSKVNTYLTLTDFARRKFIEGGLPAGKVVVKPNFLRSDPDPGSGDGGYAFFAGRICEEKGIRTLLEAWRLLQSRSHPKIALKIAGDGPLLEWGRNFTADMNGIDWLGRLPHNEIMELIRRAQFLVCPSLYHEGGPLTIIEAFACGTPVLASDLASINEFVVDGVNGFRFRMGDVAHLAERIEWLLARPELMPALRNAARICYLQNYTAERNYALLMDIYNHALQAKRL
jgi:glycosyltransferase involved in cell wall biosynthesis